MSDVIKLKQGLDIRLKGKAETVYGQASQAELYAVKPTDFFGIKPKMAVKEGDRVQAGDALFFDKQRPEVKFVSPVCGVVSAIVRGERRALLQVVVKAEGEQAPAEVGKLDVASASREQVISKLLETGAWAYLRQRPYNVVADPTRAHKAVFVSTFDTAPLAPDYDFVISGNEAAFQAGISALAKIAPVTVGNHGSNSNKAFFSNLKDAKAVAFSGAHPAGCVGVQINHVDPINAGESVITVGVQEVVAIGKIFAEGKHDFRRVAVLCGSCVAKPAYYRTVLGAQVSSIVAAANTDNARIISGNVLTGKAIPADGFLGFYDAQITVIPEGNKPEFFGWITPGFDKFSASRTFFSWLTGKKEYELDTNTHGEPRAIVVSGEMEKVLPMDIYPEHLLKEIMAKNIDKMIELGIFEVVEEDLALCEFVSTSKVPVQRILRNGLALMMQEVG